MPLFIGLNFRWRQIMTSCAPFCCSCADSQLPAVRWDTSDEEEEKDEEKEEEKEEEEEEEEEKEKEE